MMTKKNYSIVPIAAPVAAATGFSIGWPLILTLAIGIPILIFGLTSAIRFAVFMFSPATYGSIPIAAVMIAVIAVILILRRR